MAQEERRWPSPRSCFAFVLARDGCGVGPSEFGLDENFLASWCPRCGEVRVFGPAEKGVLER